MTTQKHEKNRDEQLIEFENRDLGKDIRKLHVIRPKKVSTSIVLNPVMIAQLERKARKRGIGYQTMMKIIVSENIKRY